ncbi:MAG: TolC family protein [Vicinamibacteria bacterium]
MMRIPAAIALTAALAAPALAQERPTLQLSLEDAVKRAMENNLDIRVEKFGPEASAFSVQSARSVYDPTVSATISEGSRTTPSSSALAGGQKVSTDQTVWNFGAAQYLPTGGSVNLSFANNKQDTNNTFFTFNPSYNSSLTASLTQPLLRNFKLDQARYQIQVAKRNKEISDVQFQQTVLNVVASVKNLYYDLLAAIDNLDAQRKSLALAQKLLEENRIKVRVGTMAPLDVVSAESEVASREEGVILAESALADAEDALKRAIFAQNDPAMWQTRVVPTDKPVAEPVQVDIDAAIAKAIASRTDIDAARKSLQNTDLQLQLANNARLPGLDLVASYGAAGLGGTQIRDNQGNPLTEPIPGGYGDATSSVFGRDFPTWSVGVNFSFPILNRNANATAARARLAKQQQETSLARLELSIASEVRTAGRSVETNLKRVASTRAARVLQAQRLDAEEKKFAAGMSTNFLVTQAQRDLALAEVSELRAIADYRKSLVVFDRVQAAGIGSGGGSITVSVSSAAAGRTSN